MNFLINNELISINLFHGENLLRTFETVAIKIRQLGLYILKAI